MQLQLLQPLPLKKPLGLAILVAGPYRSGTGDDPALVAAAERRGVPVFRSLEEVPAPL